MCVSAPPAERRSRQNRNSNVINMYIAALAEKLKRARIQEIGCLGRNNSHLAEWTLVRLAFLKSLLG